jgi:hypothetical protein
MPGYEVYQGPSPLAQAVGIGAGVYKYVQQQKEQKLQDQRADTQLSLDRQRVGIEAGQLAIQKAQADNEAALQPYKLKEAQQTVAANALAATPLGPLPKDLQGPANESPKARADYYARLLNYLGTKPGDQAAQAAKIAEYQLNQATKAMDDENSGAVRIAIAQANAAAAAERQQLSQQGMMTRLLMRPNMAEIEADIAPQKVAMVAATSRAAPEVIDKYMTSQFAPLVTMKKKGPPWAPNLDAGLQYTNMDDLSKVTNQALESARIDFSREGLTTEQMVKYHAASLDALSGLLQNYADKKTHLGFDKPQINAAVASFKYGLDAYMGQALTTNNYYAALRRAGVQP